ncbi:uncharacterized protein LOC113291645 [Papaver somniferum]|uniref:uncharacterized protein LOC113291645 n=1 Tax=Papaver somniferum TaxID=3469 RepID=UPI000E7054CD|nr:uncharacterized protein LOC113291645 [Papaver somniferum]
MKVVSKGGLRMTGTKWNQKYDMTIIEIFHLASFGNPGVAGFGVCARNNNYEVLGTLSGGIGVATNYLEEIYAVVCAVELAVLWQIKKVIIVSDSKTRINDVSKREMPWFIRARWEIAIQHITDIQFKHCFRKVNFSADSIAKIGGGSEGR